MGNLVITFNTEAQTITLRFVLASRVTPSGLQLHEFPLDKSIIVVLMLRYSCDPKGGF